MNVHDVVEVVPREAMASMSPETCIIIYLSHTDHTFYLRGLIVLTSVRFAVPDIVLVVCTVRAGLVPGLFL